MKVWMAISRLSIIWESDLSDKIKQDFFLALAVSIQLYGCTTFTLKKPIDKKLNRNYKRMLQVILNKSWKHHHMKQQLYSHLPPISKTIHVRWTRHVGHWLNGFKYFYLTGIIQFKINHFLHIVKWFQVLLSRTNTSI